MSPRPAGPSRDGRAPGTGPILLLALLGLLALLTGCGPGGESADKRVPAAVVPTGPVDLVMPKDSAYTGAYVDFGEGEGDVTYDALMDFEKLTGKHLAIVAFGSFWGEQQFPTKATHIIAAYGAVPLIFWSPWDKPYEEAKGLYAQFLESYPELRHHFLHVDMKRQAIILTTALMVIERYYVQPTPAIELYMRYLGTKHHGMNVGTAEFPKFFDAMFQTMKSFHGDKWNPELERQWRGAFDRTTSAMFEGYLEHVQV